MTRPRIAYVYLDILQSRWEQEQQWKRKHSRIELQTRLLLLLLLLLVALVCPHRNCGFFDTHTHKLCASNYAMLSALEFAFWPRSRKIFAATAAAVAATTTTMAKQYGKLYKNLPGQRPELDPS